jgi:pyrimidine deaminase RibD-like protein
MANIHYSPLDVALGVATQSKGIRYKVGAVIDGNHGFHVACNIIGKGHPMLKKLGYGPHCGQHAEFRVVNTYPGSAKGATVYVARMNKNGIVKASRPCEACENFLRSKGVHKVVYTTDAGAQVLVL